MKQKQKFENLQSVLMSNLRPEGELLEEVIRFGIKSMYDHAGLMIRNIDTEIKNVILADTKYVDRGS